MPRVKLLSPELFVDVMSRAWTPVEVAGDLLPPFARAIPEDIRFRVLASGAPSGGLYSSPLIPSGELIGGYDVYRLAPDDDVELNRDWYAVVRSDSHPTMLLIDGPHTEADQHWMNEIPARFEGAEILAAPKRPKKE